MGADTREADTRETEERAGIAEMVGPGWAEPLDPLETLLAALGDFLREEQQEQRPFLPRGDRILAAYQLPFEDVKVLIVGQDPYPTPGHPNGLCFSVAPDVKPFPKSLQNIFQEYQDDLGHPEPTSGDLTPWVEQGVMLLNRVLTVRAGQPASHRGQGWEEFTEHTIKQLVARDQPLVAILWGNDARSLKPMLGDTPVVESSHPSPMSARYSFFGSRPFSRANELLEEQGAEPIDWRLP